MSFGVARVHREWPDSEYWLYVPMETVVVSRIAGRGTEVVAKTMIEEFDKLFADDPALSLFTDMSEMSDYSTKARALLTAWMKKNMPRARTVHIHVRSKLVAMGVSVANLALRSGMKMHSNSASFEEAVRDEMVRLRHPR